MQETFNFTLEELSSQSSTAMEATIGALVNDGLLTAARADAWLTSHMAVCFTRKSVVKRLLPFLFPNPETPNHTTLHTHVVQVRDYTPAPKPTP